MYHLVIPVTPHYDPIVVEGSKPTQLMVFNAGPSIVETLVWKEWSELNTNDTRTRDTASYRLELRPGDQRLVTGSFMRIAIKGNPVPIPPGIQFSAVGVTVISKENEHE